MLATTLHMYKPEFEDWLQGNDRVIKITNTNLELLVNLLSTEEDSDSYTTSAAYYAFTGRKGLWLYNHAGTYIPFCWHPNIEGQILIFPPRGKKNYGALTTFLHEAPPPPLGFLLARFKHPEIHKLSIPHASITSASFERIEEEVLDWRYPVRVLSTRDTAQMFGHRYMFIRNRVRQTKKYDLSVQPLSRTHVIAIENLILRWAHQHKHYSWELLALLHPYQEALRLLESSALGLDGLCFSVNGRVEAVTLWDISNNEKRTANLLMNLCNKEHRGLSEFAIRTTAEKLVGNKIEFLNLGGSETAGLDHYKKKFSPVLSIDLHSLVPSVKSTRTISQLRTTRRQSRVA